MSTVTSYSPRQELIMAIKEIVRQSTNKATTCPFCNVDRATMHTPLCPLTHIQMVLNYYVSDIPCDIKPRREKLLVLSREQLLRTLASNGTYHLCFPDLPRDTTIVGCLSTEVPQDFIENTPVRLVIQSSAFPLVLPHERVPFGLLVIRCT